MEGNVLYLSCGNIEGSIRKSVPFLGIRSFGPDNPD